MQPVPAKNGGGLPRETTMTDRLLESMPLAPVDLPDAFEEIGEPVAAPRWSAPSPAAPRPAYGLVGMPATAVTTRDVKVAVVGLGLGALIVTLLSWFGRRG